MFTQPELRHRVQSIAGAAALLWEEMCWPDLLAHRRERGSLVLLPVGATEQHGPHLPCGVDSILATAFCLFASARTSTPMLPTLSIGCSLGHTDRWPGTLSLTPETLIATVRQIGEFLLRTGFDRMLLVNSHFGNVASLRCAVDHLRSISGFPMMIGLRSTFDITPAVWQQFTDDGEDFHANRAETALMLALAPNLVRSQRIVDDPDRTAGKVFTHVVPLTSTNGVTGAPSRATADDGRALFLQVGQALVDVVQRATRESPPLASSSLDPNRSHASAETTQ